MGKNENVHVLTAQEENDVRAYIGSLQQKTEEAWKSIGCPGDDMMTPDGNSSLKTYCHGCGGLPQDMSTRTTQGIIKSHIGLKKYFEIRIPDKSLGAPCGLVDEKVVFYLNRQGEIEFLQDIVGEEQTEEEVIRSTSFIESSVLIQPSLALT